MAPLNDSKTAAKRLCVAEGTLANWRIQGKGPRFVRIGGKICYRDEDIDAFIARGVRQSTSETTEAA
jgi:predicted site-specific integrase-resolvase